MAASKFSTMESGAQCVMMAGILMMPTWCVVSLVSPAHLLHFKVQLTVRAPVMCGWMTSTAKEERLLSLTVLAIIPSGELFPVVTLRMQVWFVTLSRL